VKKLWESYQRKESFPISDREPSRTFVEDSNKNLTVYERIGKRLDNIDRPVSRDEFDDYADREPCPLDISPLEWWCQDAQKKHWPRLSLMAIDILSIPAMSAEPERIFSSARRTVSWERAQLAPETIEKVECLKSWKRSSILET